MMHEMGWDNDKVYCRCGWISDPSTGSDSERRKDQQTQFVQHRWEATESTRLGEGNDNDQ